MIVSLGRWVVPDWVLRGIGYVPGDGGLWAALAAA